MNYITQIANKETNEETHNALIRYGPGEFEKEEIIIAISKKKIKIQAGLDMVNPIQRFFTSVCTKDVEVSGTIPTARDVGSELDSLGILYEEKRRYGKSGAKYELDTTLTPDKAHELVNKVYEFFLLLNLNSGDSKVKVKKADTPKIGSLVPKFITAEVPVEVLDKVKEEFLFDVEFDKAKKVIITHTFVIEDVIFDEELIKTDPLKARLEAKRKGVLKRKIDIDGSVTEKEYPFEV
jgi:hypothetical protein